MGGSKPQRPGSQLKKLRISDRDRLFSNCSVSADKIVSGMDNDEGAMFEPKSPVTGASYLYVFSLH